MTPTNRRRFARKHSKPFVGCCVTGVYVLPIFYGKSYIGLTGCCVNDRLREHARSVRKADLVHLPAHCGACTCEPQFVAAKILRQSRTKRRGTSACRDQTQSGQCLVLCYDGVYVLLYFLFIFLSCTYSCEERGGCLFVMAVGGRFISLFRLRKKIYSVYVRVLFAK